VQYGVHLGRRLAFCPELGHRQGQADASRREDGIAPAGADRVQKIEPEGVEGARGARSGARVGRGAG